MGQAALERRGPNDHRITPLSHRAPLARSYASTLNVQTKRRWSAAVQESTLEAKYAL